MIITETSLGTQIETSAIMAFLGNKNSTLPNLKAAYPQFSFLRVKQVHKDHIIQQTPHSADYVIEADAHWTSQTKLALCSISADCIPVLIYSPQSQKIAAIHAGWRGIAQRIIPKTITALAQQGCPPENLSIIIGPHIQMESFEVHNDVRDQLLNSIGTPESYHWQAIGADKSLVDLNALAKDQILEFGCPAENIFTEFVDTFKTPKYHSARRDKANSGRQISWIALK